MKVNPPRSKRGSSAEYFQFLTPPKKWESKANDNDPYWVPYAKPYAKRKSVNKGKKAARSR